MAYQWIMKKVHKKKKKSIGKPGIKQDVKCGLQALLSFCRIEVEDEVDTISHNITGGFASGRAGWKNC